MSTTAVLAANSTCNRAPTGRDGWTANSHDAGRDRGRLLGRNLRWYLGWGQLTRLGHFPASQGPEPWPSTRPGMRPPGRGWPCAA